MAIGIAIYCFNELVFNEVPAFDFRQYPRWINLGIFYSLYWLSIFIGLLHWPWYAALTASVLGLVFSETFQSAAERVATGVDGNEALSLWIGTGGSLMAGVAVLVLAQPKQFFVRLCLLVLGVALLLALNELSHYELTRMFSAPPIRS